MRSTKTPRNAKTAASNVAANPVLDSLPPATFHRLHPAQISIGTQNPASGRDDAASIAELAASIKQHGLLQPLIARGDRDSDVEWSKVELVAGERRLRAALSLDLSEVGVLMFERGALSDQQALEVALVENLQRKDQTPIDEARAYSLLQSKYSLPLEDIAAHVGRSLAHVSRRISIMALSRPMLALLDMGAMTVGAAEQFSRLTDHASQEKSAISCADEFEFTVIDEFLEAARKGKSTEVFRERMHSQISVAQARRAVLEQDRDLADAPWDLGDAELDPKAGACSTCPKRSAAQVTLFGAATYSGGRRGSKDADRCMDGTCWGTKLAAYQSRAVAQAKSDGAKVLPKKEADKLFHQGSSNLVYDSPLVDIDAPCTLPGKRGSWRNVAKGILPDLERQVAMDGKGHPRTLVNKKDLERAAKSAGLIKPKKKPQRDGDDARRANVLAEQRRERELADALLDAVLEAVPQDFPADKVLRAKEALLWELLTRSLYGRVLHDGKKELARRRSRGLAPDKKLRPEDMDARLDVVLAEKDDQLRLPMLRTFAIELCGSASNYSFHTTAEEDPDRAVEIDGVAVLPALTMSAVAFGVKPEAVSKKLAKEQDKPKAKKAKGSAGKKPQGFKKNRRRAS